MQVINVINKKEKQRFVDFIYQLYHQDTSFKDTLIGIVKTFLDQSDTFTKECFIRPVCIEENNRIIAQCIFIYHEKLPVLQVGFFDALEHQEQAIDQLMEEAEIEAKKHGLSKIIIGLNGHVSYGVGILMDHFNEHIPFDSLYHKSYYRSYFEDKGFIKHPLTTYSFLVDEMKFKDAFIKRVHKEFSFRYLDTKHYQKEMALFGELCNETLKNTPLYFPRKSVCMYELVKELKPFLKPENLIFALKDGKEVGFIFWHPDYNEIIPGGKKNSMLSIGLRFIFHRKRIQKMIINAIGIIEPYQRSFLAYGLLHELAKVTRGKFHHGVTNFVFDSNVDSTLFNQATTEKEDRHYCIYEVQV